MKLMIGEIKSESKKRKMFREILRVLPFDREALEYSLTDTQHRKWDETRMRKIVPDYDTNIREFEFIDYREDKLNK